MGSTPTVQLRHSRDLPSKTKRSKLDKEDEDLGSILDGGIFQLQNFLGLNHGRVTTEQHLVISAVDKQSESIYSV